MFQINEIVDNTYRILREIGRGGTGIVFLAYHLRLQKYVVIKKIKDNYVDIVNVRSEVDILKKLHHKYLPQVYDFVKKGSEVYTVIDYIEGYDLEYYMETGYQFSENEIVKWLKQMCEVLEYLHSQKPMILHSDIKPSNIMIDQNGNVCLIDFNISLDSSSEKGIQGLSQYYASPEQVEKAVAVMAKNGFSNAGCEYYSNILLDRRTDIYSLGATFYYLVSGIRPHINIEEFQNYIAYGYSNGWDFVNTFPMGVEVKAQYMDIPYSYGLLSVIDKAMELNINSRYNETSQMLKALNTLRKRETGYRIAAFIRYSSIIFYAVFLSFGILLCVSGTNKIKLEDFKQETENFYKIYDSGNTSFGITEGVKILNNDKYFKILDKNKDEKAKILHAIGDCYYYKEDYKDSLSYYKEAYEYMKDVKEDIYYRDYAIALVKAGSENISYAESIMKDNESSGSGVKIVEAQICFEKSDYTKALQLAERVIDSLDASDSDKMLAYILKSEIAEEEDNILVSIQMREKAYETAPYNKNNARKLARKYVDYVSGYMMSDASFRKTYYFKAKKIYEEITGSSYATLEDKINLAKVYTLIDENQELREAEKLMRDVLKENPDDYRVNLQLAYIYAGLEDRGRAGSFCQKALNCYNASMDADGEDYQMIYALRSEIGV